MVTIFIPTPLRRFTSEHATVSVQAKNVTDAILALVTAHPALTPYIFEGDNLIRKHVRLYVGEDDIREKQGTNTVLKDGDELSIIPAIAGGLQNT